MIETIETDPNIAKKVERLIVKLNAIEIKDIPSLELACQLIEARRGLREFPYSQAAYEIGLTIYHKLKPKSGEEHDRTNTGGGDE